MNFENFVFFLYGRYGALDSLKILSWGVGTFSTIGRPHSENFFFDPGMYIFPKYRPSVRRPVSLGLNLDN